MSADLPAEPETTNQKEPFAGEFITHSAEETFALARSVGERLKGGEVFLLKGDLGSGKTVFAKGLAAGLGIDPADVTSPTFTLVNPHEGRVRFFHIDLYRVDVGAHRGLGLQEILDDENAVTAIEWAERLGLVLDRPTIIEMSYISNNERRIRII